MTTSIVCEEVFDEKSHPSIEEIRDYAVKIGIDPIEEPQLLPIAAEGLMKALPSTWKPCFDEKSKAFYYYDRKTGKTQWEHPLDNIYKDMVKKARADSQSLSLGEPGTDDNTYMRDDLPSYEESPLVSSSLFRKLEPLLPGHPSVKVGDNKISSPRKLRRSPTIDLNYNTNTKHENKFVKQKSADHIFTDKKFSLGNDGNDKFEKHPKLFESKPELKVTGGGSMFLKTNTKQKFENEAKKKSLSENSSIKDSSTSENVENQKEIVDEEKKSVKFMQQKLQFEFSDKSDDDEEDDSKDEINPIFQVSFSTQQKPKSPFTQAMKDEVLDKPPLPRRNLKIIKPNPTDFMKPSLIRTKSSDSDEDDSPNGKIKRITLAEIDLDSGDDDDSPESPNENIKRKTMELERKMEQRVEKLKEKMWKSKNEELVKFQETLEDSQKEELKRLMDKEVESHEEQVNSELEKLKLDIEEKQQKILDEQRVKLNENLEILKADLTKKFEKDESELRKSFELRKEELEKYYEEKLVEIESNLAENMEKSRDELIISHNSILDQLKQNNSIIIKNLKQELQREEEQIRRDHKMKIEKLSPKELEIEKTGSGNGSKYDDEKYEKLRCEKRLLEDKYKCLKEKYIKLKNDVKVTIEKRNKRKEEVKSGPNTTGSDISFPTNKDRTPMHSPSKKKPPTPKLPKSKTDHHGPKESNSLNDLDVSMSDRSEDQTNKNVNDYDTSDNSLSHGRTRKKIFSRVRSSSVKGTKSMSGEVRSCSPVENLRKQLQKLEDLEDQFPHQSDTYHLRYPFSDGNKNEAGSSELEFFRHRIHLERDSIKRAKETLRSQKAVFQQRQKELKLKHGSMARHTYQQLCQEEKDLTDMEVSLHRTKSLLGEKVIRLRHLEQTLQRATIPKETKCEDATLSDFSSHSGSSGISSTEIQATDAILYGRGMIRDEDLQEPSEIIQNLETLNSEIKEIWEVLRNHQQQSGNITAVIPPFIYPDFGWPILAGSATTMSTPPSIPTLADRLNNYRQHIALANAQSTVVHAANQGATTTLVERTRNLKHWLKQAKVETDESDKPQANL